MAVVPKFVYDVCVIDLLKATSSNTLKSFLTSDDRDTYLCLGHFDIMRIQRVASTQLPLEAIQNIVKRGIDTSWDPPAENCRYPLYALKQTKHGDNQIQVELNQFWETICNFFFVIRFHCDRDDCAPAPFSDALMQRSRYQPAGSSISHLQINNKIKAYTQYLDQTPFSDSCQSIAASVIFYDSLELGDIVGIIKSDSMFTAMGILQHLCGCKAVSDAYTYCGVNSELLSDNLLPSERYIPLCSHHLTCTTTRFSIKLACQANILLQNLQQNGARIGFVTGTADVMVEWTPCTEREFLSHINTIVRFDNLYEAFSDIITRIGVPYMHPKDSRQKPLTKASFSDLLSHGVDELSSVFTGRLERWRYPVSRMIGTLQSMYESSILDALALLLFPGVKAFLSRICYLKERNLWDTVYEEDISDFLDDWTALANDISHLESQIMQHPELTPARYYIPAMVLQFERTFLMEYVGIMKRLDSQAAKPKILTNSREFAPILLPTAEESVYTSCPLDPEFDTNYTEASPLCIFLPIQRIYQPWILTHMLCHEIQHYSGDALRCRNERLMCLARSAAAYIVALLNLQSLEPRSYQISNLQEERDFQEEIASLISRRLEDAEGPPYLKHIRDILPGIMFDVAQRPENQERIQNILFYGKTLSDQMANVRWKCQLNTLANGVIFENFFFKHIYYLCGLYKECYADIAMILTLRCSFEDYYNCFYREEQQKFNENTSKIKDKQVLERHTDRLSLVMLIVEKFIPSWSAQINTTDFLARGARKKVSHWKEVCQDIDSPNYTWQRLYVNDMILEYALLADEAKELESYLMQCATKLKNALTQEKNNVASLRNHLKYVSCNGFDWNSAREYMKLLYTPDLKH